MSDTMKAMGLLIATFERYASKEGDKNTLNKGELKELLQNEFGDMLGNATDKKALDSIFKGLDANRDNSVDFNEFTNLVTCITVLCHEKCKK